MPCQTSSSITSLTCVVSNHMTITHLLHCTCPQQAAVCVCSHAGFLCIHTLEQVKKLMLHVHLLTLFTVLSISQTAVSVEIHSFNRLRCGRNGEMFRSPAAEGSTMFFFFLKPTGLKQTSSTKTPHTISACFTALDPVTDGKFIVLDFFLMPVHPDVRNLIFYLTFF